MDANAILGTLVTLAAILVVIGLYVWSARIIETIRRGRYTSLRRIKKELRHGRGAD